MPGGCGGPLPHTERARFPNVLPAAFFSAAALSSGKLPEVRFSGIPSLLHFMSKNRPHARRAARSRAFQVLYSLQFSPSTTLGDVRTAFLEMPDPTDADMDENAETREEKLYGFAWELVEGVWANVKTLDSVIERFSQNWRELTLLRLAVFEMLYRADVPPKVAINEALELSTRFGDAKAKSFINGILDAAIKAQEAGTLTVAGKADA